MAFVIIHGAFGGPEENWFSQLKESLESLGQKVFTPQFPVENWEKISKNGPKIASKNQTLANWLKKFDEILPKIKREKKLIFIGHSLGPLFILYLVEKFKLNLDCAIFVSPFLESIGGDWQIDLVNSSFYKADFDFNKLKKLIPLSYVLYSDNDPYVNKKFSLDFSQKLGSSVIEVTGARHMNSEVNLNEFPLVLELCKSRLELSLYQKYLAHRRDLYAIDYSRVTEEVIYIKPSEVFDEGLFHFRNLRKRGFCTFFTALDFWDTHSKYFAESRKAARRVGNIVRVYVVNQPGDLNKPKLLEQIYLDITAGVKVHLIMYEDIRKLVPEPDFGIWDDDYLCIVSFNPKKKVDVIKLSSRQKDIARGHEWEKMIMEKAVMIKNTGTDIKKFLVKHTP